MARNNTILTEAKLLELFAQYINDLERDGARLPSPAYDMKAPFKEQDIQKHLCWMCIEGCKFVAAGDVGKAQRWLGFVQGVLWMLRVYSLNELRAHSRGEPA